MHENLTVAVVGLGYVGSCIASTVADRGLNVVGVDTNQRLIDELNRGHVRYQEQDLEATMLRCMAAGNLTVTTDYAAAATADVVLIAVGTPVNDDGSLADEQLTVACTALSEHIRPGQLVMLKSTVPPGTTRNLVRPLLERGGLTAGKDFKLAFTPERFAEGNALAELRTFPIAVGGLDEASTDAAVGFWRGTLGLEVFRQDSMEAAEIVKLADNWWIDLNIALANELAKYCALFNVDVLDVITAANSIPKGSSYVNILLPSIGVGGSCLTKDPWMVRHSARLHGVDINTAKVGREVNAGMPDYSAQLISDQLAARGKDIENARIAVLGVAFKNNTGDLRATPAQGVVAALVKAGAKVKVYDPLVDPGQAEEMLGIRPTTDLTETVRDADCIAILAYHKQFEGIDYGALPVAPSCLILDGRAYYPKEKIAMLRELGYGYAGIGR